MLTKSDLQQIKAVVKEEANAIKIVVEVVDKKLDRAQEDISEILTEIIGRNDNLEKRVDHIEEHLNLPKVQSSTIL
jgi:hypothetical protein